ALALHSLPTRRSSDLHLGLACQRIGLERQQPPIRGGDLEFVEGACHDAGDEGLPHAAFTPQAHRVLTTVPCIEAADDGDLARIRSEEHTSELQSRENL